MTLSPGTRLGPYEIVSPLGAGGMGEVYRARDTKLNRDVAIKVLPEQLAQDAERLARFQREAQILASLNHPNIAAIYGLEESAGVRALVLELVAGPTLAERLAQGPLPIEEALDICRQIALALEAAHESGVVHRDLKPGNVILSPAGEVKVLDFGLAKGGAAGGSGSDLDLTHSPTRTYAMTGVGVILGTAAYMSPEQARGKPIDRRTDIWSFGCVLYECLTGSQTFEGETVSDMIARILEREPDWEALPPRTPARVRELLARCLEKDPRKRLRDIGDARIELEGVLAGRTASGRLPAAAATAAERAGERRARGLGLVALAAAVGAVVGALGWAQLRPAPPASARPIARLAVSLPASIRFTGTVSMTRDGSKLVLVGANKGPDGTVEPTSRVFTRALDSYEWQPVPGTEGAHPTQRPQLSVDGRTLYYLARPRVEGGTYRLFKTPLGGTSPPVAICDWADNWGGFLVAPNGDFVVMANGGTALVRLPASGGPASAPIPFDAGEFKATYRNLGNGCWIDDDTVLFESVAYNARGYTIGSAAVNTTTGKTTPFIEDGGSPFVAPGGQLLFTRSDALLAAPFDKTAIKLTGSPVSILGGLRANSSYDPAQFRLAGNGTLFYLPGGAQGVDRRVVIVGKDGKIESALDERKAFREPCATSDASRIAVTATNSRGIDEIWVTDAGQRTLRKWIAIPGADCFQLRWSPSGDRVAFSRVRADEESGIYIQEVDSSNEARRLVLKNPEGINYTVDAWSPDGSWLLVGITLPGPDDIGRLTFDADGAGRLDPFLASTAQETAPAISPDGRWVAFVSDETGREEVYICAVRPDGSAGNPIPVSRGPGTAPGWIDGGRRLTYVADTRVKSVAVTMGPGPTFSTPVDGGNIDALRIVDGAWLPDGRVVGVQRGEGEGDVHEFEVVLNWTDELRAKLAAGDAPKR